MTCSVSAQPSPPDQQGTSSCKNGGRHAGKLGEKLGLTDEQKSKIGPLVQKNRADIKAIRENASLTKDQKHAQIAAIREGMDQQMKSVLTPDQYQKFQENKAQRKEQSKEQRKEGQGKGRAAAENSTKT